MEKKKRAANKTIKGSIQHKVATFLNVHAPNNIVSKHIKQKLTELQRKHKLLYFPIIVDDFYTPLSVTDGLSTQNNH